jgi:hypothetical protein
MVLANSLAYNSTATITSVNRFTAEVLEQKKKMNENFEQNRIEVEQSDIDVCLSEIKQLFFKTNEFLSRT